MVKEISKQVNFKPWLFQFILRFFDSHCRHEGLFNSGQFTLDQNKTCF